MMVTRTSKSITTIDLSGPFFTHDPRKTFRQNVKVLMDRLAEEGERDVKAKMRSGESRRRELSTHIYPGRVSGHVIGRTKSLKGKNWEVTAVVSVNNSRFSKAEGTALMAGASNVERQTKAFRKMTARMRRAKALNTVELLKGLK